MDYVSVKDARQMDGVRLVLMANMPSPWGEAAKLIMQHHSLPFVAVEQTAIDDNAALVEWTGFRNAPILITDDEPPMAGWLDILLYAERHGSGAPLLPENFADRVTTTGLSAEYCAPLGLGWSLRVLMFEKVYGPGDVAADAPDLAKSVCRQYGYSAAKVGAATERSIDILKALAARLTRQREAGSPYLVGDGLTVADIYAQRFSPMYAPLPPEVCPMPDFVFQMWSTYPDAVLAAVDPILIEHRDFIAEKHTGQPVDF